jgi:hypothetical protein
MIAALSFKSQRALDSVDKCSVDKCAPIRLQASFRPTTHVPSRETEGTKDRKWNG